MSFKSSLVQSIASQIGTIQGDLKQRMTTRALELVEPFSNQCPSPSELQSITEEVDNMRKTTDKLAKRIKRFERFASSIQTAVSSARLAVQVLKSVPIPTSTPPGLGIPIGLTNRYSDLLRQASKRLEELEDEQKAIIEIVDNAIESLDDASSTFNNVLERVNMCVEEYIAANGETEEITGLIRSIQTPRITQSDVNNAKVNYRAQNGQDYVLEVVTDPNSTNLSIPRRYAQAKNINDIVVLRGPSSFSSSTEVLLEELKFRIDNQLP